MLLRRLFLAALASLFCLAPALAAGTRDPAAEQFVATGAQRVLTVLADRSLSRAQKEAAFRQMIDQIADVPRISGFVLGKYGRTIAPADRQRFNAAFRAYAESVYQGHIGDFHGETLRVTGSTVRAPGDVIVSTVVHGSGGDTPVAWRVLGSGGGYRIVDVQIKGVWLAITEQQDFVSTLDNAHGDINVLIAQLQRATGR